MKSLVSVNSMYMAPFLKSYELFLNYLESVERDPFCVYILIFSRTNVGDPLQYNKCEWFVYGNVAKHRVDMLKLKISRGQARVPMNIFLSHTYVPEQGYIPANGYVSNLGYHLVYLRHVQNLFTVWGPYHIVLHDLDVMVYVG